jgi:predicted ATPase/DNA-binding XRE family transcriptional regulator
MTIGQPTEFAQMLKYHRVAAGLSQAALAERAQLSRDGISALERGVSRTPRRTTIHLLADALGLTSDERDRLLATAKMGCSPSPFPNFAPQSTHPTSFSLPMPLTPLVGRDQEIQTIRQLLNREDVRLVTLTGAPGIGKTHLAVHVARSLAGTFQNGVVFVPLAPIREPSLVVPAIARALNLRGGGEQTLGEHIASELGARSLLLVLDNFEHLIAATPALIELLSACPQLKVLVTSRAVLHVRGEQEFPLPPLQHSLATGESTPGDVGVSAAVDFFVRRAAAVLPDFILTQTIAPVIAEICRRLDGLPLAIELAAARIKLLPPTSLLERLTQLLPILTGGGQDLPERQQTMRRAIAWSYDLLDARLQRFFRTFAIFAGGWTLEAAEQVCDTSPDSSMSILDALAALMDQSLVLRMTVNSQESRFRMLATLREFGLERLQESGETDTVARRHACYYMQLALAAKEDLRGPRQSELPLALEHERNNLHAAFRWAHQHGEREIAAHLAAVLTSF